MSERYHANICPDCGAYLDPGERCDCDEEDQAATATRRRLEVIRQAEQRNRQRIAEHIQRTREKRMQDFLYR